MRGRFKVSAFLTFVLAVLFYLFFQASKQNPALSQVNPFAVDPYDAVGSFGIQLALFAALLALIRAFRPYKQDTALDRQELLLLRAEYVSCLSVAVTLVADLIALLRHPAIWIGFSAGYMLAALTGLMVLLTALVGWLIHRSTRDIRWPSAQNTWFRTIGIAVVGILILVFYPDNWDQGLPGALVTIFVGAAFLLVLVRVIGIALSPSPGTFFEDFIDDLIAMYRWLKAHSSPFVVFCNLFEWILAWPLVRSVLRWLNPRKHSWNLAILIGVVIGIGALFGEMLGEGGGPQQLGQFVKVATIFIGVECLVVLLGYLLLAKPLGLFRQTSDDPSQIMEKV